MHVKSTPVARGGLFTALSVISILPENADDKTYFWSSSNNDIAYIDNSGMVTANAKGNANVYVTANDGSGVYASCSIRVMQNPCPAGAVDLGLSVYWASCNVGASKPEEYGDYYAWGETETKSYYTWKTYLLCIPSHYSADKLLKYNTSYSYGDVDNNTVLDPEDDVAHVKLGYNWRMPTDEEWTELMTKCTLTWTDNYNGTGVLGRMATGPNGKSIFLPAAGLRDDYYTNFKEEGLYWSSSLYTDDPRDAWYFNTSSANSNIRSRWRQYGLSVRPVTE